MREEMSGELGGDPGGFGGFRGFVGGSCPPRLTWGGEGGGGGGGEAPPLGQEGVVGAGPPPRRQHRVGQEVRPWKERGGSHMGVLGGI